MNKTKILRTVNRPRRRWGFWRWLALLVMFCLAGFIVLVLLTL